jgi:hypothetical protein
MPPSLPGYYFDAEKNRYFKIQANHVAPAGAKYSRQAVEADKVVRRDDAASECVFSPVYGSKGCMSCTFAQGYHLTLVLIIPFNPSRLYIWSDYIGH